MLKLGCPACGAEIIFKSKVSVFGVCTYCSSMVVRHDLNLETLGKMAELPADMSPLQIGTRGKFENSAFEIVGRLKVRWEGGSWNEWYVLFENAKEGWLAEAQGSFMMSFSESNLSGVPRRETLEAGQTLKLLKNLEFHVDDIKEATCAGSEGELPMKCPKGRVSTSVDLSREGGEFACIDYSEDGVRLFTGKYVDLDELKLTGLREIDGW
ncbi:MAG: DUF4178 domain-containing protein [Bdellovibrionales bacterium]|nr:DUF4178 domain-containing protein [Bdellovibrionales bacterium]